MKTGKLWWWSVAALVVSGTVIWYLSASHPTLRFPRAKPVNYAPLEIQHPELRETLRLNPACQPAQQALAKALK